MTFAFRLRVGTKTADDTVRIVCMLVDRARVDPVELLSEAELDALLGAAAWYAKYHERMITELADDRSALAVARRGRYQQLHNGLAKLGVRLRRPAGIDPAP